jgi:hypothetical protein
MQEQLLSLSAEATNLKPGRYRHFKGNEYKVLGVARHSETLEEMVIYQALYGGEASASQRIWIRPLAMFLQEVEVSGRCQPRFQYLGE